jgi:tRNA A64-2'-O-ribosylphosphate transferase
MDLRLNPRECRLLLVDSTRAGKRMPDALSKTVPIWCCVVNRAILLRRRRRVDSCSEWNTKLYTPPSVVSAQEHDQIAQRLDGWAKALAVRHMLFFFSSFYEGP